MVITRNFGATADSGRDNGNFSGHPFEDDVRHFFGERWIHKYVETRQEFAQHWNEARKYKAISQTDPFGLKLELLAQGAFPKDEKVDVGIPTKYQLRRFEENSDTFLWAQSSTRCDDEAIRRKIELAA